MPTFANAYAHTRGRARLQRLGAREHHRPLRALPRVLRRAPIRLCIPASPPPPPPPPQPLAPTWWNTHGRCSGARHGIALYAPATPAGVPVSGATQSRTTAGRRPSAAYARPATPAVHPKSTSTHLREYV